MRSEDLTIKSKFNELKLLAVSQIDKQNKHLP
jgi:hypothetical protein